HVRGRGASLIAGAKEKRRVYRDDLEPGTVAIERRVFRVELGAVVGPARDDIDGRLGVLISNLRCFLSLSGGPAEPPSWGGLLGHRDHAAGAREHRALYAGGAAGIQRDLGAFDVHFVELFGIFELARDLAS